MAWLLTRFDFRGKQLLTTLLDLLFSVSPVVAGLMFVLLFGTHTALGRLAEAQGIQIIFAIPGIILLPCSLPSLCRTRNYSFNAGAGRQRRTGRLDTGASGWQMFWRVTPPNIKWARFTASSSPTPAQWASSVRSAVSGHIRGETNTIPLWSKFSSRIQLHRRIRPLRRIGTFSLGHLCWYKTSSPNYKIKKPPPPKGTQHEHHHPKSKQTLRQFPRAENINLNVPTGKLVSCSPIRLRQNHTPAHHRRTGKRRRRPNF